MTLDLSQTPSKATNELSIASLEKAIKPKDILFAQKQQNDQVESAQEDAENADILQHLTEIKSKYDLDVEYKKGTSHDWKWEAVDKKYLNKKVLPNLKLSLGQYSKDFFQKAGLKSIKLGSNSVDDQGNPIGGLHENGGTFIQIDANPPDFSPLVLHHELGHLVFTDKFKMKFSGMPSFSDKQKRDDWLKNSTKILEAFSKLSKIEQEWMQLGGLTPIQAMRQYTWFTLGAYYTAEEAKTHPDIVDDFTTHYSMRNPAEDIAETVELLFTEPKTKEDKYRQLMLYNKVHIKEKIAFIKQHYQQLVPGGQKLKYSQIDYSKFGCFKYMDAIHDASTDNDPNGLAKQNKETFRNIIMDWDLKSMDAENRTSIILVTLLNISRTPAFEDNKLVDDYFTKIKGYITDDVILELFAEPHMNDYIKNKMLVELAQKDNISELMSEMFLRRSIPKDVKTKLAQVAFANKDKLTWLSGEDFDLDLYLQIFNVLGEKDQEELIFSMPLSKFNAANKLGCIGVTLLALTDNNNGLLDRYIAHVKPFIEKDANLAFQIVNSKWATETLKIIARVVVEKDLQAHPSKLNDLLMFEIKDDQLQVILEQAFVQSFEWNFSERFGLNDYKDVLSHLKGKAALQKVVAEMPVDNTEKLGFAVFEFYLKNTFKRLSDFGYNDLAQQLTDKSIKRCKALIKTGLGSSGLRNVWGYDVEGVSNEIKDIFFHAFFPKATRPTNVSEESTFRETTLRNTL